MPTTAVAECPNCHAALPRGGRLCSVCKLEIAKMPAFAAAKRAARQRGFSSTKIEEPSDSIFSNILRPMVIVPAVVIVLLVAVYLAWPASKPAWSKLPTNQTDAAQQFLTHISTGKDEGYDAAYALISPSVHDPDLNDEIGHYRQLFHVMYLYLSGEFGSDWGTTATLEVDKVNPDIIIAHIGLETLHIRTVEEKPADKHGDPNRHYAVAGVDEFDVHDAGKYLKMAGIKGVLGSYPGVGQGSLDQLDSIIGASGGGLHETKMQAKLRLLPVIRNPRTTNNYEMYQTWPIRKDPVVRHRLESITTDGRYTPEAQEIAKHVLEDSVSLEELIAAHVNDTD